MTDPIEQAIDRYNAVLTQPTGRLWAPVCLRQIEDAVDAKYGAGTWKRDLAPELSSELVAGKRLDPAILVARLRDAGSHTDRTSPDSSSPAPAGTTPAISTLLSGPPDGERKWLQGNAVLPALDPSDNTALNALDAGIEALNQSWFVVDPAQAWFPDGARFPGSGTNISSLGATYDLAKNLIPQWRIAIDTLLKAFEGSGEQLIEQQLVKIRASLTTLATDAESSSDLHNQIARYGIAANDSFQQLRGEELAKRKDIADTAREVARAKMNVSLPQGIHVTDEAVDKADVTAYSSRGEFVKIAPAATTLSKTDEVTRHGAAIAAIAKQITVPAAVAPELISAGATGADNGTAHGTTQAGRPGSSVAAPGGRPGASTPAGAGKGATSDLSKLLSALGTGGLGQQLPGAIAPAQQAAQQAAQPLNQAAQQAAQQAGKVPEELLKSLKSAAPDNQRHTGLDTAAAKAAGKDRSAATTATFSPPGPATPKSVGMPGSDARPHQLDATGKPVDKEHTGKVDKDAVPLSKKSIKPFDLAVPANGHNVQVKNIPDPRLGEMMLNMADATADKPCSVLDAAKASGMDLTSLGDPIDPEDVHVGDAVIGAYQSGMYLGEGLVMTSTGLIEDLAEVLGDNGFISEIPLPDLPDDAPLPDAKGEAPVANPAPAPSDSAARDMTPLPPNPAPAVPNAAPAPAATPAEPAAAAPPQVAPTPPPPPPVQPSAPPAPSAAAPEVAPTGPMPQQVNYQGHALG
ncbi:MULTISPECIES: hypothetical protein [Mycobacteroides]|uniref:ESX-1 secretion-associated protein EspA/EspE-like domain-containing protein n=1 Tax=Mycobacteroides saopaulense TaxID=1578165 RepID=A0ABX3C106_9MYCO|nr:MULTISPECIES: hypothetical protein [Mycobacteroides]OHT82574.1 hypothetical protein BKG68_18515 [Mycobacteroides saopaulense]OHU10116.1 hypothetical protein BKG73_09320 [Mycobacteroides saopaulense]CPS14993.1 Uncharacterised protein [Mycobacteroides abscessus]CPS52338.1 Uncharacterised protein [Mycobacteroides abscessus]CPY77836.1 Uncharacterised protein [Mycobacteroides abscessus]